MVTNETSPSTWKVHAALVMAGAALVLAGYAAFRAPPATPVPVTPAVCVDQQARAQNEMLRRQLEQRDALPAPSLPPPAGNALAEPVRAAQPQPESGPRLYARFEIPNSAVSVTQKSDGTYDIHTTDPSLAGSVMVVTAVTKSGAEEKLFIRIP